MKKLLKLIFVLILFATPAAAVDIQNCFGGHPVTYSFKYRDHARNGEKARILGHAQSACTMFFAHFTRDQICVGANAKLGFHNGRTRDATSLMWGPYPQDIRDWINARGGLKDEWTWMYASDLWKLGYKRC